MRRFSEKSPSQSLPRNTRRGKILTLIISSFLAVALGVGIIGSYAWFTGTSDRVKLMVDSQGLNVSATLSYVNSNTPENNPAESDYNVEQGINDIRTVSDKFYAGSELAYRIIVTNNTQNDINTQTAAYNGENINVKLSFDSLNKYFYDMVSSYEDSISDLLNHAYDEHIGEIIQHNSGVMLMRLKYVRYAVYDSAGVLVSETARVPYEGFITDNTVAGNFGDNQSFFEYNNLEPGQSVRVYFSIVCVQPYLAAESYRAFRISQTEGKTANQTAAYTYLYNRELQSIVIKKDSENESADIAALTFKIDKFCVYTRTSK